MIRQTPTTEKRGKNRKTQRQEKNHSHSPAFKKFEQDFESLKYDSNEMAKAVFNRLTPGPLWRLNTVELTKVKAKLTELVKHIEDTIERAGKLAEYLAREEHSMIMTQEKAEKLKILDYSDFTCQPYGENLMVRRKKY